MPALKARPPTPAPSAPQSSPAPRLAWRWLGAALVLALPACAHAPPPPPAPPEPEAIRIQNDDDYTRRRADHDNLPVGAPERVALRRGLEAWLLEQVGRERANDRQDEAWEVLQRALSLWDADELKRAPRDEPLATAAADLERFYRRRGAHREVIALLGVQITLRPEDGAARARFAEVTRWLRSGDRCSDTGCDKLITELEAAVAAWPAPFVVEQLAGLYGLRHQGGATLEGLGSGTMADLLRRRAVRQTALELARLYLRVSEPDQALAALRKLAGQPGDDEDLREALGRWRSPAARPQDVVMVAALVGRDPAYHPIAVRVCRAGAARFPDSAELQLCVGEFAQRDQVVVAISAFERAISLQPERREAWEALAMLHQLRLAQLVGDERTDLLEQELGRIEAFHEAARRRFPGDALKTSLAGALYEVGRGFYQAGHVDEAVRYLQRSLAVQPTAFAREQLAVIELKRERLPEAVALFRGALEEAAPRGGREQSYWQGKLYRGLGDALEDQGNAREAAEARRKSLAAWDRLLTQLGQQRGESDEVAEIELERGRLLYAVGERERGLAAVERAIDAAPERSSTYAEALAFLVPRGELGEALDAYHRALGRAVVSEYIKVYASLWILDLDRRLKAPEDPIARGFLEGVRGPRWHHDLARWATGRQTDEELASRADTPAKRCELDFYQAMRSLAAGRGTEAQAQWRKVLASGMMAFFEFDMAAYYLRHPAQLGLPPATPSVAAPPAQAGTGPAAASPKKR